MTKVLIKEEGCSGCLLCVLSCSFFTSKEREFSLSKAKIKVSMIDGQNKFKPVLLEDCTDCGKCVDYCYYGVLSKEE